MSWRRDQGEADYRPPEFQAVFGEQAYRRQWLYSFHITGRGLLSLATADFGLII